MNNITLHRLHSYHHCSAGYDVAETSLCWSSFDAESSSDESALRKQYKCGKNKYQTKPSSVAVGTRRKRAALRRSTAGGVRVPTADEAATGYESRDADDEDDSRPSTMFLAALMSDSSCSEESYEILYRQNARNVAISPESARVEFRDVSFARNVRARHDASHHKEESYFGKMAATSSDECGGDASSTFGETVRISNDPDVGEQVEGQSSIHTSEDRHEIDENASVGGSSKTSLSITKEEVVLEAEDHVLPEAEVTEKVCEERVTPVFTTETQVSLTDESSVSSGETASVDDAKPDKDPDVGLDDEETLEGKQERTDKCQSDVTVSDQEVVIQNSHASSAAGEVAEEDARRVPSVGEGRKSSSASVRDQESAASGEHDSRPSSSLKDPCTSDEVICNDPSPSVEPKNGEVSSASHSRHGSSCSDETGSDVESIPEDIIESQEGNDEAENEATTFSLGEIAENISGAVGDATDPTPPDLDVDESMPLTNQTDVAGEAESDAKSGTEESAADKQSNSDVAVMSDAFPDLVERHADSIANQSESEKQERESASKFSSVAEEVSSKKKESTERSLAENIVEEATEHSEKSTSSGHLIARDDQSEVDVSTSDAATQGALIETEGLAGEVDTLDAPKNTCEAQEADVKNVCLASIYLAEKDGFSHLEHQAKDSESEDGASASSESSSPTSSSSSSSISSHKTSDKEAVLLQPGTEGSRSTKELSQDKEDVIGEQILPSSYDASLENNTSFHIDPFKGATSALSTDLSVNARNEQDFRETVVSDAGSPENKVTEAIKKSDDATTSALMPATE